MTRYKCLKHDFISPISGFCPECSYEYINSKGPKVSKFWYYADKYILSFLKK